MLRALLYVLGCDICSRRFGTHESGFRLTADAEAAGWKLRRRKDGRVARSGGKDYCPACVPASWITDRTAVR